MVRRLTLSTFWFFESAATGLNDSQRGDKEIIIFLLPHPGEQRFRRLTLVRSSHGSIRSKAASGDRAMPACDHFSRRFNFFLDSIKERPSPCDSDEALLPIVVVSRSDARQVDLHEQRGTPQ